MMVENVPHPASTNDAAKPKPLTLMGAILGECFCEPFTPAGDYKGLSPASQFIELHGIQFIGLGAVTDELTARERVYDTLEQLSSRTERLISIGYLVDDEKTPGRKMTETIPLDIWSQNYPNDKNMSRTVRRTIASIKERKFEDALTSFRKEYEFQKRRPDRNNNQFLHGISAHNMGVVCVIAGKDHHALALFEEAVAVKKESFGPSHPEVAVSLDELGIQLFAKERYEEALAAFTESRKILASNYGPSHPKLCMVVNNIACCAFLMGNHTGALLTQNEAREIQQKKNDSSSAKADLELLYLAILLNNFGYLKVNVKQYDAARSCFEEALLIQQSVLGDAHNHRAIQDSRKNLDFTNAFHSD